MKSRFLLCFLAVLCLAAGCRKDPMVGGAIAELEVDDPIIEPVMAPNERI